MRTVLLGLAIASFASAQVTKPPRTRTDNVVETVHGVKITDPYRWLEDGQSAETRSWIETQNRYTRSVLDSIPGRKPVHERIAEMAKTDFISGPAVLGGRYFYYKRAASEKMPAFYFREGLNGPERLLIDPKKLSPDYSKSFNVLDVARDGKLLAYGVRNGGEDETEIRLLEVDTGAELKDRLPRGTHYNLFLLQKRAGFLYTLRTGEGTRVYEHRMGTEAARDVLLFGAEYKDDKITWLSASEDRRYYAAFVAFGAGDGGRRDVFLMDRQAGGGFRPVVTGVDASFNGEFGGAKLYLRTNWKAPNWRLVEVDPHSPAPANWREVIPNGTSQLQDFAPAGGRLMVSFLENVNSRLRVYETSGALVREIPQPTLGSAWPGPAQWERDEAFYGFTSFAQPFTLYRYEISTGKQTVWFREQPPHYDPDSIETRQVWFHSKDGTRVPMFVVSKKGLQRDGARPTLLSAYGGYGATSTPFFMAMAAILAERGGAYAFANIRGGGEFGDQWHRDGMLGKKQNSFDDFLAAAECLIENGYTKPRHLAIEGSSNGGLLVGAAMTQRPDLFRAVVCQFPHLDMIRYHKFLKAAPWVKEYGNPDDPTEFAYLFKYSPYHHVTPGTKYPATLLVTGDHDTRVAPLHARKMTARLQAASASDGLILLRYDKVMGHSGGGTVDTYIDNDTDVLSFVLWQIGSLEGSK